MEFQDQRYIKLCEVDGGVGMKNLGRHTTLTMEQETELSGVLQQMEKRLYGLSPLALRKIVFQFCERNNIQHSFNEELKCAGKKWLRLFLTRHPELSIRKPEGVSIQRALGYNRSKVKLFEEILKKELFHESGQRRISEENIFNVDETGISVNHKPNKIVATKGRKSVSIITSPERLNIGSKTKRRRMNPEKIKELSDEASCLYCDGLINLVWNEFLLR